MKFKMLLVGMAGAATLATACPAAAAEPAGCGGEWRAEQTCSFLYGGGSIGAGLALGTDPLGFGVVRLEADLPAAASKGLSASKSKSRKARRRSAGKQTLRRVLITCQAFGIYGVCTTGQSSSDDIVPVGTPLHCTVSGRVSSASRYRCDSHGDDPTGTSGEIHNGGGIGL